VAEIDLIPGTPIKLSEAKRRKLEKELSTLITDMETQNRPLFENMKIWEANYEARPKNPVKNFPFKNASNIVIPLAKMMVDSRTASTWNSIHGAGRNIWQGVTQNEDWEDISKQVTRYINWQADGNDFDFAPVSYDAILESNIHGSAVLAGHYRDVSSYVYVKRGGKVIPTKVAWNRGPLIEHVPRHQILWDTSYKSISEAPVVIRQFSKTWSEIAGLAESSDGWYPDELKFIRDHPGMDGPTEDLMKAQAELDSRGATPELFAPHDIREVTVSWPNLQAAGISRGDIELPKNHNAKTPLVDFVATIHRKTERIIRLVAQPYFYTGKPFFDIFFHKRVGRGHSVGMVKILEQLQAAMTTIFNQGTDAQTRANSIWGKTNIRALVDKPIDPSQWIFDPTMQGVAPLDFQGSDFSNIQLIQLIQATAERLSGQADPAFGRETRLGGHSAPATTTLALLERGNTLTAPDRGLLKRSLGRIGEFVATVDQQFETNEDNKIRRVLGDLDGRKVEEFMFPEGPVATNLRFNIRGLSREDNPDAEMQKQISVGQVNQNYWASVFRMTEAWVQQIQILPDEVKPVMNEALAQGLKSTTQTYKRFLDAVDIDDTENFLLALDDANSPIGQLVEAFSSRAREGAGAGGFGQGPGSVAPPGIPTTNGAAGVPGVPGEPQSL